MNTSYHYGSGDNVGGDKVAGDKISGDKIGGDKIFGDKIIGDKVSGDKVANHINQLRLSSANFPEADQEKMLVAINDIEAETRKPDVQRNKSYLRRILLGLIAVASMTASAVTGVDEFTANVMNLSERLGINLRLPQLPGK